MPTVPCSCRLIGYLNSYLQSMHSVTIQCYYVQSIIRVYNDCFMCCTFCEIQPWRMQTNLSYLNSGTKPSLHLQNDAEMSFPLRGKRNIRSEKKMISENCFARAFRY